MVRATVELEEQVYERLKQRADELQVSVERLIATAATEFSQAKPPTLGDVLKGVSDIDFRTTGPWTRDELYER